MHQVDARNPQERPVNVQGQDEQLNHVHQEERSDNMECKLEQCPLHPRIESLEKELIDHEQRIRKQEDNDTVIAKIEKDIEYIIRVLDPLVLAVQELKDRPAKRWDILVAALISGGGALVISQILG